MRSRKKPDWQTSIARERIEILFTLAGKAFSKHPKRSHRYVELARRIAKRYNIKLKKEQKRRMCKKCLHYLRAGTNARIRTRPSQGAIIVTCLDCDSVSRYPHSI